MSIASGVRRSPPMPVGRRRPPGRSGQDRNHPPDLEFAEGGEPLISSIVSLACSPRTSSKCCGSGCPIEPPDPLASRLCGRGTAERPLTTRHFGIWILPVASSWVLHRAALVPEVAVSTTVSHVLKLDEDAVWISKIQLGSTFRCTASVWSSHRHIRL